MRLYYSHSIVIVTISAAQAVPTVPKPTCGGVERQRARGNLIYTYYIFGNTHHYQIPLPLITTCTNHNTQNHAIMSPQALQNGTLRTQLTHIESTTPQQVVHKAAEQVWLKQVQCNMAKPCWAKDEQSRNAASS